MKQNESLELMRHHGIRPTANRDIVVRTLADAVRPLTLSELEQEIVTIDKSGIFRTVTLFLERHLVHAIDDGCTGTRYELCRSLNDESDDDLHAHFHCEQCHQTFCLDDIPIPEVNLPEGYAKQSANFTIKGLCPKCSKHPKTRH